MKVAEFPHRQQHQVFVEPEGWDTSEGYLSGHPAHCRRMCKGSFEDYSRIGKGRNDASRLRY